MSCNQYSRFTSRRELLVKTGFGIGAAALQALGAERAFPNFAPRAKRVIFLFQAGGPSHLDLLDYKPEMANRFDQDIPPSVFGTQRITGMVAHQDRFPVVPSMYAFKQYGQSDQQLIGGTATAGRRQTGSQEHRPFVRTNRDVTLVRSYVSTIDSQHPVPRNQRLRSSKTWTRPHS